MLSSFPSISSLTNLTEFFGASQKPKKTLIIVESPNKCKTLEKYTGFKCVATCGHFKKLKHLSDVNSTTYEPTYQMIEDHEKYVNNIRKAISEADEILLACDDDREGQAIAYSVISEFNLSLTTKRIIFHDTTEETIKNAIANPTTIDMNVVYSQRAREIDDLFIGFKISPQLYKCISRTYAEKLSCGRVQTVSLRLVMENHQEISAAKEGTLSYHVSGNFTRLGLNYVLNKTFDKLDAARQFLVNETHHKHTLGQIESTPSVRKPPEPFCTSTLLQAASSELHIGPKECMRICQKLFESGYVTYIRTDAKKYAASFVETAIEFIRESYGSTFCGEDLPVMGTSTSGCVTLTQPLAVASGETSAVSVGHKRTSATTPQIGGAHEAIRPTKITLITASEDKRTQAVYALIRRRTIESLMAPARLNVISSTIFASGQLHYMHKLDLPVFLGWMVVSAQSSKEKLDATMVYNFLTSIVTGSLVDYSKIEANPHYTDNAPSRYTEASLIKKLEQLGIGRPATYAMFVDVIQERRYVLRGDVAGKTVECSKLELEAPSTKTTPKISELATSANSCVPTQRSRAAPVISETKLTKEFGAEKNKLIIQPLGVLVIEFLLQHFSELFNYEYTAQMELELDKVANGEKDWREVCRECDELVMRLLSEAKPEKLGIKIDDNHTYIVGKNGPVIRCNREEAGETCVEFKSVTGNLDIEKLKRGEYTLEEVLAGTPQPIGVYEGEYVYLKRGKYGTYAAWGEKTTSLKRLGNRPFENITWDQVRKLIESHEQWKAKQDESQKEKIEAVGGDATKKPTKTAYKKYYKSP